jgi:TonB family protein
MIISSVFLIVERNKPASQLSEKTARSQILEIAERAPLRSPVTKEYASESMANKGSEKAGKSSDKKSITAGGNPPGPAKVVTIAVTNNVEKIPEKKIKTTEGYVAADGGAVPMALMTNKKSEAPKGVKEMQAKSDSQLTVKPDTTVPALNEVVVVGYSRSKAISGVGKYETPSGHINPQPVGGKSAFERYIQENLHHPDSTNSGWGALVELSFIVQPDGKIDSIKVVSSPGRLFSEEAIRLIKSSPQWKPAQENGKVIEEEVRIKIIFKY